MKASMSHVVRQLPKQRPDIPRFPEKGQGNGMCVHLGAHMVRGEQQLLGQSGVVHASVLAAHAQQRQVQPRKQPRSRPVRRHRLTQQN